MPTQADLLDGVVKALHLPSDYALGKAWGLPVQTISGYRKARRPFDAYMCTRVAEALDLDPREILAVVALAKETRAERRRYWETLLKKLVGAASIGACIAASTGTLDIVPNVIEKHITDTQESKPAPQNDDNKGSPACYYVKSRRRRVKRLLMLLWRALATPSRSPLPQP